MFRENNYFRTWKSFFGIFGILDCWRDRDSVPRGAREGAKRLSESRWREQGAIQTVSAAGQSMGATIPPGSRVRIQFGKTAEPAPGTIIYFRRGQKRVLHRVLLRFGPWIVERGDGNFWAGICHREHILGEVVQVIAREANGRVSDGEETGALIVPNL